MSFDFVAHKFSHFVHRRRVLIVGGADNFKYSEKPFVDVHVQINDHFYRRGEQKIRVDVLYHTVETDNEDRTKWAFHSLKMYHPTFLFLNLVDGLYDQGAREQPLWAEYQDRYDLPNDRTTVGYFANGEWDGPCPYGQQYDWLNKANRKYATKLFTGMVALAHVMRARPASIAVCGMDMYVKQTGGDKTATVESHPILGNLRFLRDAVAVGVEIDKPLENALKIYGDWL